MLEDQLLLRSGFENQRVLVETLDPTRQLDTADEVDRHTRTLASGLIQKIVLNVVRRQCFVHHLWASSLR